jgi:hypothetical protein
MKKLYAQIAGLLICSMANAGQVYTLSAGETMALDNGNVVACMPGSVAPTPAPSPTPVEPPRQITCRLTIGGLPPFNGTGYSESEAQRSALRQCLNYARGRTFLDFDNKPYNPCSATSSPIFYGYSCH